jgi:hypothetical protein
VQKTLTGLLVASSLCLLSPNPASAGGGDVAAGLLGGLAIGTFLGATAPPPQYYAPPPVYLAPPPPAYVRTCYWTRGEPVWDGYRGTWFRPRMQVCE